MITQQEVKELFDYRGGNLYWKKSGSGRDMNKPAGGIDNGYIRIIINNKSYYSHRLIWMYHCGEWPDNIDHVNHDKLDNRIENLRSVSHSDNMKNQSIYKNNTSGHMGVFWNKQANKWCSRITVNGKIIHLGSFDDIEYAIAIRKKAELKYNYHKNHGE